MKQTRDVCRAAIVAALYVALCTINPISFGPLQFRAANMLVVLPLLKRQYTTAVLLGIALANAIGPIGPIDVLFGVAAEGIGYALCVYGPLNGAPIFGRMAVVSMAIALVIATELRIVYLTPYWITAAGLMVTTMAAICAGYLVVEHSLLKKIL